MMLDRPKMITVLRRELAVIPQNDIRTILVRCVTGALPVCELPEAMPVTKHFGTFTNDSYPVLLQFTKSVLDLDV